MWKPQDRMRRSLGFDPTSYQAFMLIDPKSLKPILSEAFIIVMTGDMWWRCKSIVESTMWNPQCGIYIVDSSLKAWYGFPSSSYNGFTGECRGGWIKVLPMLLQATKNQVLSPRRFCPIRLLSGLLQAFNCCHCFSPFPQMLLISMNELSLRM